MPALKVLDFVNFSSGKVKNLTGNLRFMRLQVQNDFALTCRDYCFPVLSILQAEKVTDVLCGKIAAVL